MGLRNAAHGYVHVKALRISPPLDGVVRENMAQAGRVRERGDWGIGGQPCFIYYSQLSNKSQPVYYNLSDLMLDDIRRLLRLDEREI